MSGTPLICHFLRRPTGMKNFIRVRDGHKNFAFKLCWCDVEWPIKRENTILVLVQSQMEYILNFSRLEGSSWVFVEYVMTLLLCLFINLVTVNWNQEKHCELPCITLILNLLIFHMKWFENKHLLVCIVTVILNVIKVYVRINKCLRKPFQEYWSSPDINSS
jgi:hypothetical protein